MSSIDTNKNRSNPKLDIEEVSIQPLSDKQMEKVSGGVVDSCTYDCKGNIPTVMTEK